jgi:hypothetical protein
LEKTYQKGDRLKMEITFKELEDCQAALSILVQKEIPKDFEDYGKLTFQISKNTKAIQQELQELNERKKILQQEFSAIPKKDDPNIVEFPSDQKKAANAAFKSLLSTKIEIKIYKIDFVKYPLPLIPAIVSDLYFMFNFPPEYEAE